MRLLLSNAPWAGAVVCVKASIDIVIGQIVLLGLCGNQIPFILEGAFKPIFVIFGQASFTSIFVNLLIILRPPKNWITKQQRHIGIIKIKRMSAHYMDFIGIYFDLR